MEMKDWLRIQKPMMIVLLEPKISGSGASEVCNKLGKTHWICLEADGFSEGVWLLWNADDVQVDLLVNHRLSFMWRSALWAGSGGCSQQYMQVPKPTSGDGFRAEWMSYILGSRGC